jgi:hypothetical protein
VRACNSSSTGVHPRIKPHWSVTFSEPECTLKSATSFTNGNSLPATAAFQPFRFALPIDAEDAIHAHRAHILS